MKRGGDVFTLQKRLEHAIHHTLGQKPPLEHGVVSSARAHHPLQVM